MSRVEDGGVAPVERRRRYWTPDEKRRIIAESLEEGASAASVARRHGLNANLLFTWRRQLGVESVKELARIVPVMVATQAPPAVLVAPSGPAGRMEITLSSGERIVVGADVETAALARVVKALSRR